MNRFVLVLMVLVIQVACTTTRVSRAPGRGETARAPRYAQTFNSAMDGCLRNPGCAVAAPGDEAIIPGLSRALGAARTAKYRALGGDEGPAIVTPQLGISR